MYDAATEVLDYLPKDPGYYSQYINHLWGAFKALDEKEEPVRLFGILPFHLLFMFAVQYKVYRLSAQYKSKYLTILNNNRLCRFYDKESKSVLQNNSPIADQDGTIPRNCSVGNLSLIPEKHLFNFFKIIDPEVKVL